MKQGTSFLLGVAVGAFTVLLVGRLREVVREEDVESLKDRISENLRSLEGSVNDLAAGLADRISDTPLS